MKTKNSNTGLVFERGTMKVVKEAIPKPKEEDKKPKINIDTKKPI